MKDISQKKTTIIAEYMLAEEEQRKMKSKKKIDYYSFLIGYNRALAWFREGKQIK